MGIFKNVVQCYLLNVVRDKQTEQKNQCVYFYVVSSVTLDFYIYLLMNLLDVHESGQQWPVIQQRVLTSDSSIQLYQI